MKRFAIFVFLLIGMVAFAQVAITGSIESGAKIVSTNGTTTIQHFSWNNGGTGWGQVKLHADKDKTAIDMYLRAADSTNLTVPYLWLTQKYFKDSFVVRVGKMDATLYGTPYQGFGGVGGQGVQLSYTMGKLGFGGFVPLNNVAQDISSLEEFKAGMSYGVGPLSFVASYQNAATPVMAGSASGTFGPVWAGVDVQNTNDVLTVSPYVDFTTKNGKFNTTVDVWTDSSDWVKTSETALWLNYWFVPEFRVLGRVIYTGAGDIKTREGFVFKPSANTTFRAQVDSTWTGTPVHTLNAFISQSF